MTRRPYRLNRFVLVLLGLVLMAAGALRTGQALRRLRQYAQRNSSPSAAQLHSRPPRLDLVAAGAVSVLIALLALGWLRAQLHLPRPANDNLDHAEPDGLTRIHGSAPADALAPTSAPCLVSRPPGPGSGVIPPNHTSTSKSNSTTTLRSKTYGLVSRQATSTNSAKHSKSKTSKPSSTCASPDLWAAPSTDPRDPAQADPRHPGSGNRPLERR